MGAEPLGNSQGMKKKGRPRLPRDSSGKIIHPTTFSDTSSAKRAREDSASSISHPKKTRLNHLDEEESQRERSETYEKSTLELTTRINVLRDEITSFKPTLDNLSDLVQQQASKLDNLASLQLALDKQNEEKSQQIARLTDLVTSLQQQMVNFPQTTFQLETRGITPPGFSVAHPSQPDLLAFLSSVNHSTLLPLHYQAISSSLTTYLESYILAYSTYDTSLPQSLVGRSFTPARQKIAPEVLAKKLLAKDPNFIKLTLDYDLIHPAIDRSYFDHFLDDPDLPISHSRLRRALQYVAKTSSEYPPTHFNQRWPQIIRDAIAYFDDTIKNPTQSPGSKESPTKFSEFLAKVNELLDIIRIVKASGEANIANRLRKHQLHYLCAFLVGGVSGLLYVPGSKVIPPECLVILIAYLNWYLTQPTTLVLKPDQHWPRCHQAILNTLLEEDPITDKLIAGAMTADYISFWTLHSSDPIPWPQWRTLKESRIMPTEISPEMMFFLNGSDDVRSKSSHSPSESVRDPFPQLSDRNAPPELPSSETDRLIIAIQQSLEGVSLPPASSLIKQLCSTSPVNSVSDGNDEADDQLFFSVNQTLDALFGIELGPTHITGGRDGLELVLSWLGQARAHSSWKSENDQLLNKKLERILEYVKNYES